MKGHQLYAFDGSQSAALPGPAIFPVMSNDVPLPPRYTVASTHEAMPMSDEKARMILGTVQVPPDSTNTAFFSQANIDRLQHMIIEAVALRARVRIDPQSEQDLILIMRAMYMLHRVNRPTVTFLNHKVVEDAVSSIIDNLTVHDTYLRTEERRQNVLDWGINTSIRGTKTQY